MTGVPPTTEPFDPAATVRPAVVVLPAVSFEPPFDELMGWLERLPIATAYEIPGADGPLHVTESDGGIAVVTTGLGKAPAATTVTALWGVDGLDLSSSYWLSAGIAGAAPGRAALGSVFVADAILDWDRKHRWDPSAVDATGGADVSQHGPDVGESAEPPVDGATPPTVERLTYLPDRSLHEPDPELVERAREAAADVALAASDDVRAYQERYPDAPAHGPRPGVGPTVTSDEFWHGRAVAREVEFLCAAYGIDPYRTTQMEDAATATALDRFDAADRYLSLRAVANYDRPAPGESVHDSFEGTPESVKLATENVVRVGRAVVDRIR